ncbi:uncharacterized protein LOC134839133 [Symsagittifera roscoffensis]|uniref:uncharacterized protein LOC134839133 n=1 Tax=Symsagittifera roscoffensis TaxID=84072 RepID=UPI00307CA027
MGELSNIPDDESSHLEKLRDALLDAPVDLALFSGSLRRLFNEVNVTGQDDATRTFLEVRDSTRQQSIVYSKEILPKTEEAIKMISSYMDSYSDLDFDEWAECLNDTLEELKEAKDVCEVLRHMHNEIIIGMKKNEDKAVVGIEKLEEMKNQYARQRQDLIKEARESKEKAQSTRFWGAVFGGVTLGISAAICEGVASGHDLESDRKTAEAVAKLQNAEIASKAVMLTSTELIPAIGNFIKSLEVCVSFINLSKTKVEKMISAGNHGAKQKYYKMMKNRAKEISELCEMFVSVTDRMRNNLAAIPENPDDKNYVDQWLERQLEEFAQKEERDRSRFVKYFRSQTKAVKNN